MGKYKQIALRLHERRLWDRRSDGSEPRRRQVKNPGWCNGGGRFYPEWEEPSSSNSPGNLSLFEKTNHLLERACPALRDRAWQSNCLSGRLIQCLILTEREFCRT